MILKKKHTHQKQSTIRKVFILSPQEMMGCDRESTHDFHLTLKTLWQMTIGMKLMNKSVQVSSESVWLYKHHDFCSDHRKITIALSFIPTKLVEAILNSKKRKKNSQREF